MTLPERKRAGLLLGMILVMSMLDMIGVASIMPFMAILNNSELVETNTILNTAYTKLRFSDPQQFLFALGILFFILLVSTLAFKALTTYVQLRFALMREYSIGKRLIEGYLHQPYSWFLNRHSSDLGKNILSEVNKVINLAVIPMMTIISQGTVALALLALLIIIDPQILLIVVLTLSTTYVFLFKANSSFLKRIGKESVEVNQMRFSSVSEAFGAFKEVKVGGLEQTYINRFSNLARAFARLQATASVISQLPRFATEAIAFGGMLLVVLYHLAQKDNFVSALPVIAVYAFAGYRLLPALQQVYGAVTQLRFCGPSLDALHTDLMSLQPAYPHSSQDTIQLKQAITMNQIQYQYPNAPHPVIKKLSLTIPAKSTLGVVGATGSGKTTMADLILGLLEAQVGTLEVDGQVITKHNKRAWQRAIGYVPQQIYLVDDTVAANIAFGIEVKDIDQNAIERAARIANLHDFVVNELPRQYQTIVGERGVRLSGGQRQRISIARAMYNNPQVLILDEATNALDNLTEQAVMESVHNLGHEITIILIAHRLSTVKSCDNICLLEKGELKAYGTYTELNISSETFKKMTKIAT